METEVVEKEVALVTHQASSIQIASPEDRINALAFIRSVKSVQDRVSAFFDPMVKAANKAHKEVTAARSRFLVPLREAETTVKDKVTTFDKETGNTEKKAGEFIMNVWKGRVVELRKLPLRFLMADQKAIDAFAKETQGKETMPGIEFYCEETLCVRKV
jgi:hypothetical protein